MCSESIWKFIPLVHWMDYEQLMTQMSASPQTHDGSQRSTWAPSLEPFQSVQAPICSPVFKAVMSNTKPSTNCFIFQSASVLRHALHCSSPVLRPILETTSSCSTSLWRRWQHKLQLPCCQRYLEAICHPSGEAVDCLALMLTVL